MGTVVVDTSVLLGLLDAKDALHGPSVAALKTIRSSDRIVITTSIVSEMLVGASRESPEAVSDVEAFIDDVADIVLVIDRSLAREAARLRARHRSLKLPDAFVLAAAVISGADSVLTADARWARYGDGDERLTDIVRVVT
jgi:predicted nucleic acid-binding protein